MTKFITNRSTVTSITLLATTSVFPKVLAKEEEPNLVKPKDLSIYPDENKGKTVEQEDNWKPTIALDTIKKVREEVVNFNTRLSGIRERGSTFFQTGIAHTESFVDNLRQENNSTLRAGFVVGGGLTGLLLAIRKGKFKKIIYTTSGATAAFYVGYPKESEEVSKTIKRYSLVSYHLINNITKDVTGFELPPLPAPKDLETSSENKPDLKTLFSSSIEYINGKFDSLKKLILNNKDVPDDKSK
ncbi:MICOS complex subunit Mic27 [Adelges cooleyi]|uniref:MICOS complex subunit Mic27 n=1 Tax=Adelges cooleyi TaxID=133065 RepID=UPI00217F8AF0|nr:MICOS complex subunit Mic27 [Adelges cooleyi]